MIEAKNKEMRDIRGDLQDRANRIRQQIRAEQAQFEILFAQVWRKHNDRLEHIRAQLEAVTRLLQFASWHHDLRMAAARALALAATAEIAAREFSQVQSGSVSPDGQDERNDLPLVPWIGGELRSREPCDEADRRFTLALSEAEEATILPLPDPRGGGQDNE